MIQSRIIINSCKAIFFYMLPVLACAVLMMPGSATAA